MKVYYVTQVFKQGINNYINEFRITKSLLLQVYLGAWAKLETVNENHVF